MLIGVVHGAIEACNSNEYPSIYTRVNSPEILEWIMKEAFDETVETFDPSLPSPTLRSESEFFTCKQGKYTVITTFYCNLFQDVFVTTNSNTWQNSVQ